MSTDAYELWDKADEMPDGHGKILLLQEAARLADSQNDIELGYDIRNDIIEVGIFSGYPLDAIVAFSWCIAQFDKNPDEFDPYDLLWQYKWVLSNIDSFPEVPMDKIIELFEDMKKRYKEYGASMGPYYSIKCGFYQRIGEKARAEENFAKWIKEKRDDLSDCHACELDDQIDYYVFIKDYDKALKLFQEMLSKRIGCAEVPHITYSKFLIPFLEMGRKDEAQSYHEKGYGMINKNRTFVHQLGDHLLYLAITNINEAVTLFQKHFSWAFETTQVLARFNFYLTSWILFERLKKAGHNNPKINLKGESNIFDKHNLKDISDVIGWFEDKTRDLATKFDKRNGTDYYNNVITNSMNLMDFKI
jgi:tetratricopeptide (TPR) repeat protein